MVKKTLDKHGNEKLDKENPNKLLRNKPIKGLVIMNDLNTKKRRMDRGWNLWCKEWKNILTRSLYEKFNELELRGYIGLTLFESQLLRG